jgi:hypothetical protein
MDNFTAPFIEREENDKKEICGFETFFKSKKFVKKKK